MNKMMRKFDEICESADRFNAEKRTERFFKLFEQRKKYVTVGLYDSVTKKHVLFDSINLVGNFRYNNNGIPGELFEMERMITSASR
jgi:hypothetical protein